MTLQECRDILINIDKASRNKEKRDKIYRTIDKARSQRIAFHTSQIRVERTYTGEYKVVIE